MTTLPQTKEELSSQIPALKLLMNLGYTYLKPEEVLLGDNEAKFNAGGFYA